MKIGGAFKISQFVIHIVGVHHLSGKEKEAFGRLTSNVPQVPARRGHSDLYQFRQTLPVYQMGSVIINKINESKVILIAGETGSGKTTQVSNVSEEPNGKYSRVIFLAF